MSEWISVDEMLPELGYSVLTWNPENKCCFMAVWEGDYGWTPWQGGEKEKEEMTPITHWMPLPDPPQQENGE